MNIKILLPLILCCTSVHGESSNQSISLSIICDKNTIASKKEWIVRSKKIGSVHKNACIDKSEYIKDIIIEEAQIKYLENTNTYVLMLITKTASDLKNFSKMNYGREMVLIKKNEAIISADIYGLMDDHHIPIIVQSEKNAESIGNIVFGDDGSKPWH